MPDSLQKKRSPSTGPGERKSLDDSLKDLNEIFEKNVIVTPGRGRASRQSRAPAAKEEGEVFVSYAWGGESEKIVDTLEQAFASHEIQMIRDKKHLRYRGSIDAFERRIGQGKCIVLVITDKYLRSKHCMYELVEADENRNLRDRIFPIVLSDATIYEAIDRLAYITYWDQKIIKLNRGIKRIETVANLDGITDELDKFVRIRASFAHLVDLLADMNALTPEMHAEDDFSILIDAVASRLGKAQPAVHALATTKDLSLENMIEIFERDFVKVEECDAVSGSLQSLIGRLSFPPRFVFRKGPYARRIQGIINTVGAFRAICDQNTPKMKQDKAEIHDLLTDLLRDLKKHGAIRD